MEAAWIIPVAFLLGSVPTGFLMARARGVDIRTRGSGNIGATNVRRVLGTRAAVACLILDALKGLAPALTAGWMLGALGRWDVPAAEACVWVGTALGAVLGHVFTPWLGFKGGKGVATGLGAMLGVWPGLAAVAGAALLVWVGCMAAWRMVGLSSVVAGVSLPALAAGAFALAPAPMCRSIPFVAGAGALALLVVYTHRGNIGRILAGTEPRVGRHEPPTSSAG